MNKPNLRGQKFDRLTVLEDSGQRYKDGAVRWWCKCDCGVICLKSTGQLRSGQVRSCGCLQIDSVTTHGETSGGKRLSRLYTIWGGMNNRPFKY